MSDHGGAAMPEQARFGFGRNWARYLALVDDDRVAQAETGLRDMLERDSLDGLSFLDIGSGSGLFSLAARNLGATVHSFDYDPDSVGCTEALRARYRPGDDDWVIERGDALDQEYLGRLGSFDVVYSWGVLHHTGDMWRALDNVAPLVKGGGQLFIALYNDQGRASLMWSRTKRLYNALPSYFRWIVLGPALVRLWGPTVLRDMVKGRPFSTWQSYKENRGMTPMVDVVDWVGGWPFEVAKPDEVFSFFGEKGFQLEKMKTVAGGHGCNEYVFRTRRADH